MGTPTGGLMSNKQQAQIMLQTSRTLRPQTRRAGWRHRPGEGFLLRRQDLGDSLPHCGHGIMADRTPRPAFPHAFAKWDQYEKTLHVKLHKKQIENSPSIDSHLPVSRQYEEEYYHYYGWPAYWQGGQIWGTGGYPVVMPLPPQDSPPPGAPLPRRPPSAEHPGGGRLSHSNGRRNDRPREQSQGGLQELGHSRPGRRNRPLVFGQGILIPSARSNESVTRNRRYL